jgi:hypothetical protein
MVNLGFQELAALFILVILPVGLSILFYWLGRKVGYKKGWLDAKRQMDKNVKGYESF